jgi:hypothetical protein
MSGYSAHEEYPFAEQRVAHRHWSSTLLHGVGIVFWGLVSFALTFVELVAEVVAPLLLMIGGLWWAALKVLETLPLSPEIKPMMQYFPTQIVAGGHVLTPVGLLVQGLWLLAVVAACRTLNSIIVKQT